MNSLSRFAGVKDTPTHIFRSAPFVDSDQLLDLVIARSISKATFGIAQLAMCPSLLPCWASVIFSDPEAIEQLSELIVGNRPAFDVTRAELMDALRDHPMRWLRVIRRQNPDALPGAIEQVRELAEYRWLENPRWVLPCLQRQDWQGAERLPDLMLDMLCLDEVEAYHAMRWLRDQALSPELWVKLEGAIRSPRWAYHALRDALIFNSRPRVLRVLAKDPAWVAEYIGDAKMDECELRYLLDAVAQRAAKHPLLSALREFGCGRTAII